MPIPQEWLDPIEAAASLIAPPERLKTLVLEPELANPNRLPGGQLSSLAVKGWFATLLAAEDEVITSARDTFHLEAPADYGLLAATYLIIRAESLPGRINQVALKQALNSLGLDGRTSRPPLATVNSAYRNSGTPTPSSSTRNFHLLEARLRSILVEGEKPRPCLCPRQHTHS
jgi:hypothetical protein